MGIQQNMSFVNDGYESLGETLRSRTAELKSSVDEFREAKQETDDIMTWLKDMKKTAASWNDAPAGKDSVKTQLEQQKVLKFQCHSLSGLFSFNHLIQNLHTYLPDCFLNENHVILKL